MDGDRLPGNGSAGQDSRTAADGALGALLYEWGEFYLIWRDADGELRARRREGAGGDITAREPDGLQKALREDHDGPRPAPCGTRAGDGPANGPFTLDGTGVIPGAGGHVDHVVQKLAWLTAHPGGEIGRERPVDPGYTARWPDGSVAASASRGLGTLMSALGKAEGRCPVHGTPS